MRLNLVLHHLARGMVHRYVVLQVHQQPALLGGIMSYVDAHQRRLSHIHLVLTRIELCVQLLSCVSSFRLQFHFFHRHGSLPPHHLHRLWKTFPHHCRPQNIVPVHHCLHCLQMRIQARSTIEGRLANNHVRISSLIPQVMEQDSFLQRRQRIDVLYIGSSTWHIGDHALDLFCL